MARKERNRFHKDKTFVEINAKPKSGLPSHERSHPFLCLARYPSKAPASVDSIVVVIRYTVLDPHPAILLFRVLVWFQLGTIGLLNCLNVCTTWPNC